MKNLKLIYDKNCTWEISYIKELFSNVDFELIFVEQEILNNKLENEDSIINNNILVFSLYRYTFNEILGIVKRIKPKIIVYLSDEYGNNPEYSNLASYTNLLLHQYHFNHYSYNYFKNTLQIPLGYMTNMFPNNGFNFNVKPVLERKYIWSFIGDIKKDRLELIQKFSKKFNNHFVGKNILPSDMFTIYNDSIFVPVGRGNSSVDCFRIYEAIFSGSIPIIICNEDEFKQTFYFNNDILPPFFVEKTWDLAIEKCEILLNDKEKLINTQKRNYEWLHNKIKSIQESINKSLI
jgi:hypothetical protein